MNRPSRVGLGAWALASLAAMSPSAAANDAVTAQTAGEERPGVAPGPVKPPSSSFENALRLARMLDDGRTVARLLAGRALAADAPQADVAEAVAEFENMGDPKGAQDLLERRLHAFPEDNETRMRLIELLSRLGRSRQAIPVWEDLQKHEGALTTTQAVGYARLLSRVGDETRALQVLSGARPTAADDAHEFWDDLGSLAWQSDDTPDAIAAYRKLWALQDRRRVVLQRLTALAVEAGATDEAIAASLEDFHHRADAESLLQAARLEAEKQDWPAVLRTLALPDAQRGPFERNEEYWLLFAEAYEHLGNAEGARASYHSALVADPESAPAKGALLWDAIDHGDLAALRDDLGRWRASAVDEPTLWAPFAVGLDRLGRTREAIGFYARHLRGSSSDLPFVFEFADALTRVGADALAFRLRRFALQQFRESALAAARTPQPTADDRSLAEESAEFTRDVFGAAAGERWFHTIVSARGLRDRASDAFVADWCLHEERLDCARQVISLHGDAPDSDPKWSGYRLQLALADDDGPEARHLLDRASLDLADRIEAFTALEDDASAAGALTEALDRPPSDATDDWRRQLTEIAERHEPSARAGLAYDYISGLDVYGVEAGAAHDVGRARVLYSIAGREMGDRNGSLSLPGTVSEGDAFVLARWTAARGVTEVGAGLNYQTETPMPRASFLRETLLTAELGASLHIGIDDRIDDTGLLRLDGAQYLAELGLRYDFSRVAYAEVDAHAREDHTRRFQHIATEVGEAGEIGYKIIRSHPEWDVGVQVLAHQRDNTTTLPSDIVNLVPVADRTGDLSAYLPPSYQLVSIVTHLTRGDFFERYRPDRASFPRYDCSAGVGLLFPDLDGAFELQCSASFLALPGGYVSAVASIEQGILGIANQTNTESLVTYTQAF